MTEYQWVYIKNTYVPQKTYFLIHFIDQMDTYLAPDHKNAFRSPGGRRISLLKILKNDKPPMNLFVNTATGQPGQKNK